MQTLIRKITLILEFTIVPVCVFLSNAQIISGDVKDKETLSPLPYANVILLNKNDSSFITGAVTDENGFFSINTDDANVLLRVSFLGYNSYSTQITSEDVGTIYLKSYTTHLSEVTVTSVFKIFKLENGGISVDIQGSRFKDMGSLSDVIGQMPFVRKEGESFIVFGKGTPVFYVNNRKIRDNNELNQINSRDIRKVSVITNPSAEYDASVNSVIKIETIRPVGDGISGSIQTFAMYNSTWSNQDMLSMNYRNKSFDIFGRLQFEKMSYPNERLITNNIETAETSNKIILDREEDYRFTKLNTQAGINYLINKVHAIGHRYENSNTIDLYGGDNSDITAYSNNLFNEYLKSNTKIEGEGNRHYINSYYNGKFSDWLFMKLDVDYINFKDNTSTNVKNVSINNDIESKIITEENANSELYAGKLTLNSPLFNGDISYGTEISYTVSKQKFDIKEELEIPGILSSNVKAKQNLYAYFLSYDKSFGNLYANLGLRYEDAKYYYYNEDAKNNEQSKKYNNIFPSISFSYKPDNIQLQLAYRTTISRPNYSDLRSTVFYDSPNSYYSGNPYLLPTYDNSLTAMISWKDVTFLGIFNTYTDRIVYLPQLYLENSLLIKPINIDKSKKISINTSYSPTIDIWKPILEVRIEKDYIEYGIPIIKYNKPVYSASLRNNFLISDWQLGFDVNIRSSGNIGAEYYKEIWNVHAYINRSFLNNKLLLNINGRDIFNTNKVRHRYVSNNIISYYDSNMHRQYFFVRLTYRFNSTNNRYKGNSATNETYRL
jgi:hypothetical protein